MSEKSWRHLALEVSEQREFVLGGIVARVSLPEAAYVLSALELRLAELGVESLDEPRPVFIQWMD
ncbi:MAG TPA: hypothetical protein VKQ30_26375 [Ktedonobacterales bacterium]|nr:hypothetical protein [Ktedonobacterales bacterium]